MALPFFNRAAKKPDQIVAVDLGGRQTKAVLIQRHGERYLLLNFAVRAAPAESDSKELPVETLGEHLKNINVDLGERTKLACIALCENDSLLRHAEMPLVPVSDLRLMLKHGSKTYLQQDLSDYVFDCQFIRPKPADAKKSEAAKAAPATQKNKVLVGGARKKVIDDMQAACRAAGLVPAQIVPGLIAPANAFEMAEPEIFAKEVVALVDIGFRRTSISILDVGELALNRVVNIGGDHLTSGLAEALGISDDEAEGIKVGMPSEVQHNLEPLIAPLGRELRTSIEFFEHQQDKALTQVFISGGSSRGEFIVATLQNELMAPCQTWNPTKFLQPSVPPQKMPELEAVAPLLTFAVGAAMAAL